MTIKTFCIEIDCGNDAFYPDPTPELARIVRALAEKMDDHAVCETGIFDINGNRVGNVSITRGNNGMIEHDL